MVLLQVYTKCIKTKYKVRILSKGTLVFFVTSVLSIVLPFILAYKSKGFWMKRDVFYEFPDVRFQGKYIFIASTNNVNLPIVCSSYPTLMNHFKHFSSCSQIRVREIDYNNDKMIDELYLGLKINLPHNVEIHSFTLILPLNLKLHISSCPLEMQTEVILQQLMPEKLSDLTIFANMRVQQTYPLQCSSKRINRAFNYSVVKEEDTLKNFKIENIIQTQKTKNVTTTVSNMYVIRQSRNKNHFMIDLKIRYSEHQFYYEPQFMQIIKWAWIQYYVLYIMINFMANKMKNYIFEKRLVLYYKEKPNKID